MEAGGVGKAFLRHPLIVPEVSQHRAEDYGQGGNVTSVIRPDSIILNRRVVV